MILNIKLEKGAIFQSNNENDTGYDVCAWRFCSVDKDASGKRIITHSTANEVVLEPLQRVFIDTGVSAEWDSIKDVYWNVNTIVDTQMRGRSGLNTDGILCQFGTIDEIYRNRVGAILINLSNDIITIKKGDRIGQIVIGIALKPKINIVDKLNETNRGLKGFGSSGR